MLSAVRFINVLFLSTYALQFALALQSSIYHRTSDGEEKKKLILGAVQELEMLKGRRVIIFIDYNHRRGISSSE